MAVVIYYLLYQDADNPDSTFNHQVHSWSANLAVALIVLAVVLRRLRRLGVMTHQE